MLEINFEIPNDISLFKDELSFIKKSEDLSNLTLSDEYADKKIFLNFIEKKINDEFDGRIFDTGLGVGSANMQIEFKDLKTAETAENYIKSLFENKGLDSPETNIYDYQANLSPDHPLYYEQ